MLTLSPEENNCAVSFTTSRRDVGENPEFKHHVFHPFQFLCVFRGGGCGGAGVDQPTLADRRASSYRGVEILFSIDQNIVPIHTYMY